MGNNYVRNISDRQARIIFYVVAFISIIVFLFVDYITFKRLYPIIESVYLYDTAGSSSIEINLAKLSAILASIGAGIPIALAYALLTIFILASLLFITSMISGAFQVGVLGRTLDEDVTDMLNY